MGEKMPMDWHRMCFENWSNNIEREKKEVMERLKSLNESIIKLNFYKQQIEKAESENRDGFDRDRYMIKKPK